MPAGPEIKFGRPILMKLKFSFLNGFESCHLKKDLDQNEKLCNSFSIVVHAAVGQNQKKNQVSCKNARHEDWL
jgi:hypothetical protein